MFSNNFNKCKSLLPPVLSGTALKWIALITMFIDHIGAVLLSQATPFLRQLGRISFPIFCFLLVEGFYYTSNRKKYAMRLFLFALLSEIPFDLCFCGTFFDPSYQNVMFTLLIGFLTLWGMETLRQSMPAFSILPALLGLAAGAVFKTDYNWRGILLILILYFFYFYPVEKTIAGCLSLLWEPFACFAFIPINMYSHEKGKGMKYFFYLFYPLHLLLLYCIRLYFF